jgi:hypothetical protein
LNFGVLTPLSAISWQPVLVVEEAGVRNGEYTSTVDSKK